MRTNHTDVLIESKSKRQTILYYSSTAYTKTIHSIIWNSEVMQISNTKHHSLKTEYFNFVSNINLSRTLSIKQKANSRPLFSSSSCTSCLLCKLPTVKYIQGWWLLWTPLARTLHWEEREKASSSYPNLSIQSSFPNTVSEVLLMLFTTTTPLEKVAATLGQD